MEKGGLVGIASKIHVKCTFVVVKKKKKKCRAKRARRDRGDIFFFIRRRVAVTLMRWRYRGGYVREYSLRALLRLLHLTSINSGDCFCFSCCTKKKKMRRDKRTRRQMMAISFSPTFGSVISTVFPSTVGFKPL